MKQQAFFQTARKGFHRQLFQSLLTVNEGGVPSIADKKNSASVRISKAIYEQIGKAVSAEKMAAQTAGNAFEEVCASFLESTFSKLNHLRPGQWTVLRISQGDRLGIARYEQYAHLSAIAKACKSNPELATVLGSDYIICPDIVIFRQPEPDSKINEPSEIVDDSSALHSSLRKSNGGLPLIHASISCKLTLRSDRAQNARSEALNLIRNRKGRVPHIAVVTAEPLPSRLSSLALGTGDIDCVYHFALPELQSAIAAEGNEDSQESLKIMVEGKRLRDISDLPLDLAI
jgi:hypothetical protein